MSGLASYVAFALPLGTDSAAVCTAYGATSSIRLTWRRRLAVCGVLTMFEAGMPGVGMLLAGPVGHVIGETANYFAGLLLVGIGLFMLFGDDDEGTGHSMSGMALLAVGFAISVDEIAVGVSLGLHGASFPALAATIAAWVGFATMAGISLGERVPKRLHSVADVAAATMLIALGLLIGAGVL